MTSIAETTTVGSLYTWADLAHVPWTSKKPWTAWAPYSYDVEVTEPVAFTVSASSNFCIQSVEHLGLGASVKPVSEIYVNTTIGLAAQSVAKAVCLWNHKSYEYLGISAVSAVTFHHSEAEGLGFSILAPVGAKTVLYDLQFYDRALTREEFLAEAEEIAPLNYSKAKILTPGDYTWGQAIVGLQVLAPVNASRVGFSKLDLYVDVPDIIEKGSLDLDAELTSVEFNNVFHAVPQVYTSFISGTILAIPKVTDVTQLGFTIGLYSANDSATLVAGKVNFLASGY